MPSAVWLAYRARRREREIAPIRDLYLSDPTLTISQIVARTGGGSDRTICRVRRELIDSCLICDYRSKNPRNPVHSPGCWCRRLVPFAGWTLKCCGGYLADDLDGGWWLAVHRDGCPDNWQVQPGASLCTDCGNEGRSHRRGRCTTCYQRYRRVEGDRAIGKAS